MRHILAIAIVAVSSPVSAQGVIYSTPGNLTSASPSAQDFARFASHVREGFYRAGAGQADIARAGAWGRCVVARAPEDSRAFASSLQTTTRLRWMFERCLRGVGDFALSGAGTIRRAALIDALRPPAN